MKQSDAAEPPQPPQPPPFQRRIQIGWLQVLGVGLLLLIPLAALTGLLGLHEREAQAEGGGLALSVRYPARMHHKTTEVLEVQVRNAGTQALEGVTVRVDGGYLAQFGDTRFMPQVQRLNADGAELDLGVLPPGESRRIVARLEAEGYGGHKGRIVAQARGGEPAALDIATFVLP